MKENGLTEKRFTALLAVVMICTFNKNTFNKNIYRAHCRHQYLSCKKNKIRMRSQQKTTATAASCLLKNTNRVESRYFAGDPATTFHELRRFLFTQGVESMLYTASKLPSGFSSGPGVVSSEVSCIDNAFYSEFRTMVAIETSEKRVVINSLVLVIRVFIDSSGDGSNGIIQIVLNHLHDGIMELNGIYGDLCDFFKENGWQNHQVSNGAYIADKMSLTSSMVFQSSFTCVHEFTSMYFRLKPVLEMHNVVGCYLQIEGPY
jgi:hypothetical protein